MIFEFFSPGMSQILCNAGAEFVVYDMEHTGLDFETLKWLFATCRGLPLEPMVRVPGSDYHWLARALDIGARGIMIPMVESQAQAKQIVQACRYPNTGRRGAAFGFAQCNYQGGSVVDKVRDYNDRTVIIAQIETERGMDNIDAIAAVEGIDVLWLGHFDLSNFLGIPGEFDNPRFLQAMERIATVARQHGKAAAFLATDAVWTERARRLGYTMLAAGPDTGVLQQGMSQLIQGFLQTPKA